MFVIRERLYAHPILKNLKELSYTGLIVSLLTHLNILYYTTLQLKKYYYL